MSVWPPVDTPCLNLDAHTRLQNALKGLSLGTAFAFESMEAVELWLGTWSIEEDLDWSAFRNKISRVRVGPGACFRLLLPKSPFRLPFSENTVNTEASACAREPCCRCQWPWSCTVAAVQPDPSRTQTAAMR